MGGDYAKNWREKEIVSFLIKNGCVELKCGSGHRKFRNPATAGVAMVQHMKDTYPANMIKTIAKQIGIPYDDWKK